MTKLAVSSIQRNHSRHLLEWLAWYQIMGVDKFYIYDHMSTDDTFEIWQKLSRHFDITLHQVSGHSAGPYYLNHYIANYRMNNQQDWIIQADADEFYVPTDHDNLVAALDTFRDKKLSCLGIYWVMFGSNGQIEWEPGLVVETYVRRGPMKHFLNHHIKSIVRCGPEGGQTMYSAGHHMMSTEFGTYDTQGRLITQPLNYPGEITHDCIRLHHYYNKSLEYFRTVKQVVGQRADRPPGADGSEISEEFWRSQDLNDEYDDSAWVKFGKPLKEQYNYLRNLIGYEQR